MQREIKFRAWWKHPEYKPEGGMFRVGGIMFARKEDGEPEYDFGNNSPVEVGLAELEGRFVKMGWNDAAHCVLMQYTGLKDKNGKEIYEGDVLAIPDEEHVSVTDEGEGPWEAFAHLVPVSIEEGSFGVRIARSPRGAIFTQGFWPFTNLKQEGAELEIIGNIYENTELLTV